jgi:multidrug transporter EmrE-like cation transporter
VSTAATWIAKSLVISAALALATGVGFFLFFRIHQELNIAPNYAWWLGAAVFLVSAVSTMIYFCTRTDR